MNLSKIAAGKNPPRQINVFIEIPQGSAVKYEFDKKAGLLVADRFLHTATSYPFNYGFIPGTQAQDGDPVDAVLISSLPLLPGTVVAARPVGLLEIEDEKGPDNKIIAVPVPKVDPELADIKEAADLNKHLKQRLKHFFESYKKLEPGKWVKTGEFLDRQSAEQEISRSLARQ